MPEGPQNHSRRRAGGRLSKKTVSEPSSHPQRV